ncbi:MAG: hypothetical protein LIQ31_10900 [Planctomycetes bacterium]|nr:hypothetical protein [Planctomycetota bacterium]
MKDTFFDGTATTREAALARLVGGTVLGTVHDQRFFAMRANGDTLRFPFPARTFTALVNMSGPVDDALLQTYAQALIDHGCIQAACRGEGSDRLVEIFDKMAEQGDFDHDGTPFTCMPLDDEPLEEAIQYFVLPCGLAQTGLVMVIGDSGDFENAINGFSVAAGAIKENIGEPDYIEDDLVCFISS